MMEWKSALLHIRDNLYLLPLIYFCFYPVYAHLKSSMKMLVIKMGIAVFVYQVFAYFLFFFLPHEIAYFLNFVGAAFCFFEIYKHEVDLPPYRLLFLFMTACLIASFSYLFMNLIALYGDFEFSEYNAMSSTLLAILLALECFFITLLHQPCKHSLRWALEEFNEDHIWQIVWLFPAAFTIFAYFMFPYESLSANKDTFLGVYLFIILVFLIINILIYMLFYQVARSMKERQYLFEKTSILEIQEQQYHHQIKHMEDIRKIHHDIRHHMMVLSQLVETKQYGELQTYLKDYANSIPQHAKRYCASITVNAVLNHYEALCSHKKIKTNFYVHLKEELVMDDIDISVMLGNLLENAYQAVVVLTRETPYIELRIAQTAPRIIALQICNPFENSLRKEQHHYLSTKRNGTGQGLKSVQLLVDKYHGHMEIQHKDALFEVKILVRLKAEEKQK